jgi:hypothetical protein
MWDDPVPVGGNSMYIRKKEYGGECLEMGVDPGTDISQFGIGSQVQVTAIGTVSSVRAPYKGPDYDTPWDYSEEKKGKKRPTKVHPGRIEIDLEGKPNMAQSAKPSGIADLTAMMDAEELD